MQDSKSPSNKKNQSNSIVLRLKESKVSYAANYFFLIQHRASSIEYRASRIQHRVSSIEHRESRIQHRVSRIEHRASSIEHRVSSIEYRVSRIEHLEKLKAASYNIQLQFPIQYTIPPHTFE